ncbi:colicin immunity protein Cui [Klebsiella sp. CTHL.F3a]|uniref:colicin immunity protein Cui n=1 Tax=Klebsiella pasteurii TaxID=2587529 RepID=UPI001CA7988B|nr:colicin immunity protein Cui [Klebsiella sp. CTHL.F3a]
MEGKGLFKYSLISFCVGLAPILIMFSIYFSAPDSPMILNLFAYADGHARTFSDQHLQISTIASAYTKIAPCFVVLMYLFCWNKFNIKSINLDIKRWLKLFPVLIIFTISIYALLYIGTTDLSTSSRKSLRLIAQNEYLLMTYYMGIYLANYFFIWLFIFYCYPLKALPVFKKRE